MEPVRIMSDVQLKDVPLTVEEAMLVFRLLLENHFTVSINTTAGKLWTIIAKRPDAITLGDTSGTVN